MHCGQASATPSATGHSYGRAAAQRVESCRRQIADEFGCEPDKVIFTSGATEADNLALTGGAHEYGLRPGALPVHQIVGFA